MELTDLHLLIDKSILKTEKRLDLVTMKKIQKEGVWLGWKQSLKNGAHTICDVLFHRLSDTVSP
jgi:hypothetical protein